MSIEPPLPGLPRLRRQRARQDFQMVRPATSHALPADGAVESDETSFERGGEPQQIKIRKILRACPGKVKPICFQYADRIGPKTMTFDPGQLRQYVPDPRYRKTRNRVPGLTEDTQTSVFRNRAGSPSVLPIVPEPRMRGSVKFVRGVHEGDQDVDIQQAWFL